MKNLKLKLVIVTVCILVLSSLLNADLSSDYKVLKKPFKTKIIKKNFPSKLKLIVKEDNKIKTRITINFLLINLFENETINMDNGRKIKISKIIKTLKKNPEKMIEMYEDDGDDILWIWLE